MRLQGYNCCMHRKTFSLAFIMVLVLACRGASIQFPDGASITKAPTFAQTVPNITVMPDAVTATPTTTATQAEPDGSFTVRLHPEGGLFAGDQVSFEIIAPEGSDMNERTAEVKLTGDGGEVLGTEKFQPFGIAGRMQSTQMWSWDTSDLQPGVHTLSYTILPGGPTWTETVTLQEQKLLPYPEPEAEWTITESDCCVFHYITGTDAERDIEDLMAVANAQAEDVSRQLDTAFSEPVPIVLVPRVLGHGGFANAEISISYLDQNYAGSNPAVVLHHEMVHLLDGQLGGELRPSLLVEGLAVYLSDGHFKEEPLYPRAAALLDLGWYLPLSPLAERFYTSQHEIGYLEAGALVKYMVDRWGWEPFEGFYRDIHPGENGGGQAEALNTALLEHFELTLPELENDFLEFLANQPRDPFWSEDVRLTVLFYDAVRRYQQILDPSAYYLTAWLPDGKQMRERGIVSDYLRHPSTPENQAIETMLVGADEQLVQGKHAEVQRLLDMVNAALDAISPPETQ